MAKTDSSTKANRQLPGSPAKLSARLALADRLHSLAIHLLRRVRVVDQASGISARRISVLSVLVFGGERRLRDLARLEQVSSASMSRMIDGLVGEGLVLRRPGVKDRREVALVASAKGRRVMQRARQKRVEALSSLLTSLNRTQRKQVADCIELLEPLIQLNDQTSEQRPGMGNR